MDRFENPRLPVLKGEAAHHLLSRFRTSSDPTLATCTFGKPEEL